MTDAYATTQGEVDDLAVLFEFYQMGEGTEEEVEVAYQHALKTVDELEFKNMLSNEEDQMNCMININSGAGGTESQDWAEMLMRMYIMYADKHGLKAAVVDEQAGDGAGILMQVPHEFCCSLGFELPALGQYGTGRVSQRVCDVLKLCIPEHLARSSLRGVAHCGIPQRKGVCGQLPGRNILLGCRIGRTKPRCPRTLHPDEGCTQADRRYPRR